VVLLVHYMRATESYCTSVETPKFCSKNYLTVEIQCHMVVWKIRLCVERKSKWEAFEAHISLGQYIHIS
jgi:hypothetical protein